jgi:nitrite reductase/ring-hydroxylating ferredoxin subunit
MTMLTSAPVSRTSSRSERPPDGAGFPEYPVSWYYFGRVGELQNGPVSRELFGHRLVAFRTELGKVNILDARCCHLGTDLGRGKVVGEGIQCPYHHWEFGSDGICTHIPAGGEIPAFARQRSFPTAIRHGYLFVFNDRAPLFPLPFYEGEDPDNLICSSPHEVILDCPWYLIGANAFDLQHYRASHDRELLGEPVIDCPTEFSRRAKARFTVSGNSLQDRLTRLVAGGEASLSITDYCGNMMLATARFRRASSFGLVMTQPLGESRVLVRLVVMKRRSSNPLLRLFYDPLSVAIRKMFFSNFLAADAERLAGVRYNPGRLIAADQFLKEYFQWLARASNGRRPAASGNNLSTETSPPPDIVNS